MSFSGPYPTTPEWFEGLRAPATQQTVHERIAATLRQWVDNHPSPDMPALSLAEMGEYSPRQIQAAVEAKTEVGQFVEVLIVNGVRFHPDGLDGVLQSFVGGNSFGSAIEGQEHEKP